MKWNVYEPAAGSGPGPRAWVEVSTRLAMAVDDFLDEEGGTVFVLSDLPSDAVHVGQLSMAKIMARYEAGVVLV